MPPKKPAAKVVEQLHDSDSDDLPPNFFEDEQICTGGCPLCQRSCCHMALHAGECRCEAHRFKEDVNPKKAGVNLPLRELGVDPVKTRPRYTAMLDKLEVFLKERDLDCLEVLATTPERLDEILERWIQCCYDEQQPKSWAPTALSAVQDKFPNLKGCLKLSWKTVKNWAFLQPGDLRLAWPLDVACAISHLAHRIGQEDCSLFFLLTFHCLLRPMETCMLRRKDFHSQSELGGAHLSTFGLIVIRNSKTKRRGARLQHVLLENQLLVDRLWKFFDLQNFDPDDFVFQSYAAMNKISKVWLDILLGPRHGFSLGGLRAGGATYHYLCCRNLEELQRRGRWASAKTLDHYIQIATPFLSLSRFPETTRIQLQHQAASWRRFLRPHAAHEYTD